MTQQAHKEVLMRDHLAGGGEIPNDMADKIVEEGVASTKNEIK